MTVHEPRITTYEAFWPFYLGEHALPATRAWHFVGTGLVLLALAAGVVSRDWRFFAAAPICGYFFAWVSHFFVEHNRPATFTYPLWSLVSDFRMFFLFVAGRLGAELRRHGIGR
ncbi:DUF962 domain-containing protein [Nitrospirillum sp. BR 11752]|uniref:DUF962 domain-containing protein n=1 Tax=Nitrospirillum sp. BR 11752 TaxID=3104293 RepID=UPI002EB6B25A|nr:DUF962 domain-containing protein [Nitrospirillum sp. BR 11752]